MMTLNQFIMMPGYVSKCNFCIIIVFSGKVVSMLREQTTNSRQELDIVPVPVFLQYLFAAVQLLPPILANSSENWAVRSDCNKGAKIQIIIQLFSFIYFSKLSTIRA